MNLAHRLVRVGFVTSLLGYTTLAGCGGDGGAGDAVAPSAGGAGGGVAGAAAVGGAAGKSASAGASGVSGKGGVGGKGGATAGSGGSTGAAGAGGASGVSGAAGSPQGGSGGKGGSAGAGGKGGNGGSAGKGQAGSAAMGGAGLGGASAGSGGASAAGAAGKASGGMGSAGASGSSVPTKPIAFTKEKPFTVDSGTTNWVYVPASYDDTHATPTTLLVWLHGCGGKSEGDIWVVSPGGAQSWISLAVGGQEGNCWDVDKDPARVLAALADIKTHFNIKPKGVVLGGYSSGGDLTYRTAFYNASLFAGVIVENSSPYRDTGSKEAASLAAAAWKFNAVHLAHLQDTTYPIAGVQKETDSMTAAGFPMKRIEVDGGHYDNAGAIENGHPVPGTSADLATYLLPCLDKGWTAP